MKAEDKQHGNWPFIGALILAFLNVDYVLYNLIRPFVPSFWHLYFILMPAANVEIVLWYKFWRWFWKSFLPEKKRIKETIQFSKDLTSELKRKGYIERIQDHLNNTFEWAMNPNRFLFRMVQTFGHVGMIFLGVEPFISGGRLVGVVFCATTGWKNGLYSLCLGNAVHVAITIWSWEWFYYFFGVAWNYIFK